nr:tetratricopeptide repeat protein [Caldilineaceae bacterium]
FDAEDLQRLLNKSLVQGAARPLTRPDAQMEPRFRLLEMVREYAYEQLTVNQEAEQAQWQHAVYYARWAEAVEPYLRGSQAKVYVAKLEAEHNNLRAALAWALATDNAETALRLGGALGRFWLIHGHVREGKTWLAKALSLGTNTPSAWQAKACMMAGEIESVLGDFPAAQALFEQSLPLYRAINDGQGVAWALCNLGDAFYSQNAYAQAREFYQQSLALCQALEDKWGLANLYTSLGWLAVSQGDYEQARIHFIQGVALHREQGEQEVPSILLKGLACVASQQQDYQQASASFVELLLRARDLEDTYGIAYALNQLGQVALYQGNLEQATIYLRDGFGVALELGYPALLQFVLDNQGNLAFAQGHYAAAINYYTQSLEIACQIKDTFQVATLLERLAGAVGAQQKVEQATRLLGAAAKLHEAIGAPLRPSDRPRYQATIATVRAQLDEIIYATAYAEGYAMTPDQAVAFALGQSIR